jgi:hypothetical protein
MQVVMKILIVIRLSDTGFHDGILRLDATAYCSLTTAGDCRSAKRSHDSGKLL